jgi:hypothetical protein
VKRKRARVRQWCQRHGVSEPSFYFCKRLPKIRWALRQGMRICGGMFITIRLARLIQADWKSQHHRVLVTRRRKSCWTRPTCPMTISWR